MYWCKAPTPWVNTFFNMLSNQKSSSTAGYSISIKHCKSKTFPWKLYQSKLCTMNVTGAHAVYKLSIKWRTCCVHVYAGCQSKYYRCSWWYKLSVIMLQTLMLCIYKLSIKWRTRNVTSACVVYRLSIKVLGTEYSWWYKLPVIIMLQRFLLSIKVCTCGMLQAGPRLMYRLSIKLHTGQARFCIYPKIRSPGVNKLSI